MNELKTTILFGVTAAVLAAAAMVIDPGAATPDVFSDQGEAFLSGFHRPAGAEGHRGRRLRRSHRDRAAV